MIAWDGWWTRTPSATSLQPKKWNTHFWITFNFWWLAGQVNGLEPHPPFLSSQKIEMLIFGLCSTSDDQPGWSMDSNPICHLSPAKKKWNTHFWIMFNFWWLYGLVDGLKPHLPPLSSQKNEMLIFGLHSTSDDWPGWSMDLNAIWHLSPAKKMKCSFLDYVQLLMMAGLVDGLEPHLPPLSSQNKMKCSFLDYVQLLMIGQAGWWTWMPSDTSLQPKNEMLIFGLCSTSDDGQAGWWTWTPSATSLQPKKWNAHFWITFNFWWSAGLVNGLKPHLAPLSSQKN